MYSLHMDVTLILQSTRRCIDSNVGRHNDAYDLANQPFDKLCHSNTHSCTHCTTSYEMQPDGHLAQDTVLTFVPIIVPFSKAVKTGAGALEKCEWFSSVTHCSVGFAGQQWPGRGILSRMSRLKAIVL